jgi:hypothetical protein
VAPAVTEVRCPRSPRFARLANPTPTPTLHRDRRQHSASVALMLPGQGRRIDAGAYRGGTSDVVRRGVGNVTPARAHRHRVRVAGIGVAELARYRESATAA